MAGLLKIACRRAVKIAIDQNRVSATLTRLDGSTIAFCEAGIGSHVTEAEGIDGNQVRVVPSDLQDLIVWPDQLAEKPLAGELVEIKYDDRSIRTFEVTADPPDPCWRYTDRFATGIRIHMKER